MSHAHRQWNRMKKLASGAILLGGLIAGSAVAWAGTVIVEEDLNAEERSEGRGVHFALIRDGDLSRALTVEVYLSESGSMIGGEGSHSVTMAAEHDLGRLDVWTVDDDIPEGASTVSLRVLPGSGYTVGSPSTSSVRVTDDDASRSTTDISAVRSQIAEGARAVFRITRTGDTRRALPLQVWIESDAVADANVGEVSANIPAGRSSTDLGVPTQAISRDGSVTAHILQGTNENVSYAGYAVVDVIKAVSLSTVSFRQATGIVDEGKREEFVIERDPARDTALTVHYSVDIGSHTNVQAGTATTGSVTIPARGTSAEFSIHTVDDGVFNPNGRITGRLRSNNAYRIGSPSAKVVTVRNRDSFGPGVTLSLLSGTVTEGGTVRYQVELDAVAPQAQPVSISLRHNGDFFTAGAEALTSVTVVAGERTVVGSIATVNDEIDEHDGSVEIALSANQSQVVTATIRDNDLPSIRFVGLELDNHSEGRQIEVALERSGIDLQAVTARVTVEYEGFSPTRQDIDVAFAAGKRLQDFSITLPDDSIYNSTAGRFRLTLVRRDGYRLGSNVATGWKRILDNDLINTVINVAAPASVTEGSSAVFTFTRSARGASHAVWANHQIGWSDIGGWWPVVNERCYRLIFPDNSERVQLRVPILDDPYDLGNTRIIMRVSGYASCEGSSQRAGYSIGTNASAEVRIEDNDATNNPPEVYVTSASETIDEGQDIVVRLHRTGSTTSALPIAYNYAETGNKVSPSRRNHTIGVGKSYVDVVLGTYQDAAISGSSTVTVSVDDSGADHWGRPNGKSSAAFILHPTRDTNVDVVVEDTSAGRGIVTLTKITEGDIAEGSRLNGEQTPIQLRIARERITNTRIRVGIKATEDGGPWLDGGAKTYWFDMAPDETTKDIEIALSDDQHSENNGWVKVELLPTDAYDVAGTLTYTVNVTDNDPYFRVDRNPLGYEVYEGNDATVTVTLVNGESNKSYTFQYATQTVPPQVGGATEFTDFEAVQEYTRVIYTAGQTEKTVRIRTYDDYPLDDDRNGPRELDSAVSEIFLGFQAAKSR